MGPVVSRIAIDCVKGMLIKIKYHREFTALLTLVMILYNVLLIGGGRGPFTLYDSFWICHCNEIESLEAPAETMAALPAIRGSLVIAGSDVDPVSINSDEMCRHPALTEAAVEHPAPIAAATDGICKTKLPIKYVTLLLENAHFLSAADGGDLIQPISRFASLIPELSVSYAQQFNCELAKPPRMFV